MRPLAPIVVDVKNGQINFSIASDPTGGPKATDNLEPLLEVRIERLADSIPITIQDNGRGMDKIHAASGSGQIDMRERVQVIDGTFEIESKPGEVVTIMAILPLIESTYHYKGYPNE